MWKKLKGSVVKQLHSLEKKLYFLFFIWCANLAKHLVKKGKQHISKEWTKQLTQMPIIKPRQAQPLMNCRIDLIQVCGTALLRFQKVTITTFFNFFSAVNL